MKKILYIVSITTAIVILCFLLIANIGDDVYQFAKGLAAAGTLAPAIALLGAVIALLSIMLAFQVYKKSYWKAHLRLGFGLQNANSFRNLDISKIKYNRRKGKVPHVLENYGHHYDILEKAWEEQQLLNNSSDSWVRLSSNALDVVSLRIENHGRGPLRFSPPSLLINKKLIPISFLEARKNGQLITMADQNYCLLENGEVADFYYSFYKLTETYYKLGFYSLKELSHKLSMLKKSTKSHDKVIDYFLSLHFVHTSLYRFKQWAIKQGYLGYKINFAIDDNTNKRVSLPLRKKWFIFPHQTNLNDELYRIDYNLIERRLTIAGKVLKQTQEKLLEPKTVTERLSSISYRSFISGWGKNIKKDHEKMIYDTYLNPLTQICSTVVQDFFDSNKSSYTAQSCYLWGEMIANYLLKNKAIENYHSRQEDFQIAENSDVWKYENFHYYLLREQQKRDSDSMPILSSQLLKMVKRRLETLKLLQLAITEVD